MKCKSGYKLKDGKCVSKRDMIILWIIIIATILDLFIVDPIPIIDEVGLIAFTVYWWKSKLSK